MNATPASKYKHRNQNGSTRAFHSRACGATRNTTAHSTVMMVRKFPTRFLRARARTAPAPARTNSQVSPLGNRLPR